MELHTSSYLGDAKVQNLTVINMKYRKAKMKNGKPSTSTELRFEDFTFDETDVTNSGIQKLITKDIIHEIEPMLVGLQILEIDTKLVGRDGRIRTFRTAAPVSDAIDFNAGDDVPAVTTPEVFATKDAIPTKFGHSEVVLEDAIDAMDIDAVVETEHALALGMARKSDSRVWLEVLQATVATAEVLTNGDGSTKRFALDHPHVLSITSVTVNAVAKTLGTDFYCDFFRGALEFKVAPGGGLAIRCTYLWTANLNILEATNIKTLSRDDVVDAKTKIKNTSRGKADTCVCNENEMNDLEKDEKFTDASRYGSADVLMNGEIGKTANIKFIVSDRMYEGIAFVCQKGKRLGYYVYKKKPVAKVVELQDKSGDLKIKTWEKSIPKLVNEQFGTIVCNCHQYAKVISSGAI